MLCGAPSLYRDEGFKYRSQRKQVYFFLKWLRLLQDIENFGEKKVDINLFEIDDTELREHKLIKRTTKC